MLLRTILSESNPYLSAILLKTYSHLLDHHSQESAQKVSF
jgi:hypothetical protein